MRWNKTSGLKLARWAVVLALLASVFSAVPGCSVAGDFAKRKGATAAENVAEERVADLTTRTPDLQPDDAVLTGVAKIARAAAGEIKASLLSGDADGAKARGGILAGDIGSWALAVSMTALAAWLRGKKVAVEKGLLNTAGAVEVIGDEMRKAGIDETSSAAVLKTVKEKAMKGNISDGVESTIRALLKKNGVT